MTIFQVRHAGSRAILWTGVAADADRALEAAAQAAGYHSIDEMPETLRGGIAAEQITF
jgi:hypothetical protein